jgi:hypothetical protein
MRKLLKSYEFLNLRDGAEMAGEREELHFVLCCVDATRADDVQRVAARLNEVTSPFARALVYVTAPDLLGREPMLLFQELGARWIAKGPMRNEELKERLKRACLETHQMGSLEAYEADIDKALHQRDKEGLRRSIERLKELPSAGEDVLRLMAMAHMGLGDTKRGEIYLKKLLQANPQNLWAANTLGRHYLRTGMVAEGIEVLER